MRELYVTGHLHNRSRMAVASYLTKHLLTHWKVGCRWFEDHLIDCDPGLKLARLAVVGGSGPDATRYVRVFNPVTQLDRFDKDGGYVGHWIAEGQGAGASLEGCSGLLRRDPATLGDVVRRSLSGRARGLGEGAPRAALAAYETRGFLAAADESD